ncbi:uncharacterized protein PG998_010132 [Apiospora kogelbergensis]|uniref:uncharacterized protein n=1 Tax=Apiospora kogelbergensis TaxID=1337665 RepID=UPI00312FF8C1
MSEDSVPKNGVVRGPPKCKCCTNWVEQYPDDLRESIEEKEDTKAKAILARMKKSHQDGKPLALDSIVVQNTDLKAFLVELLHGYQGITPNLNKVVLKAPFHPFFYRWDRFKDLMSQNDIDFPAAPPYPSLLYDLLRPEIEPLVDDVNDMVSNKVITYDMLWAIFQPMQELHAELQGHKRMCIHESHDYTKNAFGNDKGFEVVAKYVDWDGEKFGLSSKTFTIKPFSGTKPIDELEVCPFELIKWPEDTRNKLLDRGRKFRELCSVQHKSYKGMALVLDLRRGCYQHTSGCTEIPLLRDDELILCSNILPAYCFTSKRWALLLDIDSVLPISWNDDAFSKLVLPASHKDLVLSFMEAHISGDVHFDDIIKGKGLGFLMLLVGDPGLGKTLTAEAVAEKVHRSLYILSAGELGRDAGSVEKTLQDVLNMTAKWNAVLLLDECDVFLEERNSARLDHNAIVAVFLRLVEYYKGILILTSNRANAIDRAFQSRIHLTLRYPSLSTEAKTAIWKHFVQGTTWAAGNTLTDEHYEKLNTLPVNGREIKNIVKTSFLLASRDKAPLSIEHLKESGRCYDRRGVFGVGFVPQLWL